MPKITLEEDVVERLFEIYKEHGHPLGKNRRKRKKWIARFVIKIFTDRLAKEDIDLKQ